MFFSASDTDKTLVVLTSLLLSAAGSLLFGYYGDKFGLKKTLNFILFGWVLLFPIIAIAPTLQVLLLVTVCMGLLFGGAWAVSRALLSNLLPEDSISEGFTWYTLSERFASFVGPFAWSLVVMYANQTHGMNYRFALASMSIFVCIGIVFLAKVRKR